MEMTYNDLGVLLKKAYKAEAKRKDDMYAEVKTRCYCGGGFETNITCSCIEDEDRPNSVAYYVQFVAEGFEDDDDFEFDMGFGVDRLRATIEDYYKSEDCRGEMADKVQIEDSEVERLKDLGNGQAYLFESILKSMKEDAHECEWCHKPSGATQLGHHDCGVMQAAGEYGFDSKTYLCDKCVDELYDEANMVSQNPDCFDDEEY